MAAALPALSRTSRVASSRTRRARTVAHQAGEDRQDADVQPGRLERAHDEEEAPYRHVIALSPVHRLRRAAVDAHDAIQPRDLAVRHREAQPQRRGGELFAILQRRLQQRLLRRQFGHGGGESLQQRGDHGRRVDAIQRGLDDRFLEEAEIRHRVP
jgi:hypothetical protein